MYDILQLNDMLVPELLDIAEQLKIPNAKKLNKQELIYKVLDKQAVSASEAKGGPVEEKGKRKRIIKATTANSTEEAVVESGDTIKEIRKESPKKKVHEKPAEKPAAPVQHAPAKRGRKKPEAEEQPQQRSVNFTPKEPKEKTTQPDRPLREDDSIDQP